MFSLQPCASAYAEQATSYFEHTLDVPLSPNDAFDLISMVEHEHAWFPDFRSARWLTDAPHGVGSLREYRTSNLRATELFTCWERGKRLSFTFIALSLPLARRFMEDYRLTPHADGTRIRWRLCFEPSALIGPVEPLVRRYFQADFAKAAGRLATFTGGKLVISSSAQLVA